MKLNRMEWKKYVPPRRSNDLLLMQLQMSMIDAIYRNRLVVWPLKNTVCGLDFSL